MTIVNINGVKQEIPEENVSVEVIDGYLHISTGKERFIILKSDLYFLWIDISEDTLNRISLIMGENKTTLECETRTGALKLFNALSDIFSTKNNKNDPFR